MGALFKQGLRCGGAGFTHGAGDLQQRPLAFGRHGDSPWHPATLNSLDQFFWLVIEAGTTCRCVSHFNAHALSSFELWEVGASSSGSCGPEFWPLGLCSYVRKAGLPVKK